MKNEKIYDGYKKKADFLLNFQLCRAYLGENCGVARIVEIIILNKFREALLGDDRQTERVIGTIRATQGKRNAIIDLPRLDFKQSVESILAEFVEKKFDKMVAAIRISLGNYPLKFRDIVEQFS